MDLATPLDGAAGALRLVEAREALAEGVRGRRCGVRPGAGRWQADGCRGEKTNKDCAGQPNEQNIKTIKNPVWGEAVGNSWVGNVTNSKGLFGIRKDNTK